MRALFFLSLCGWSGVRLFVSWFLFSSLLSCVLGACWNEILPCRHNSSGLHCKCCAVWSELSKKLSTRARVCVCLTRYPLLLLYQTNPSRIQCTSLFDWSVNFIRCVFPSWMDQNSSTCVYLPIHLCLICTSTCVCSFLCLDFFFLDHFASTQLMRTLRTNWNKSIWNLSSCSETLSSFLLALLLPLNGSQTSTVVKVSLGCVSLR